MSALKLSKKLADIIEILRERNKAVGDHEFDRLLKYAADLEFQLKLLLLQLSSEVHNLPIEVSTGKLKSLIDNEDMAFEHVQSHPIQVIDNPV